MYKKSKAIINNSCFSVLKSIVFLLLTNSQVHITECNFQFFDDKQEYSYKISQAILSYDIKYDDQNSNKIFSNENFVKSNFIGKTNNYQTNPIQDFLESSQSDQNEISEDPIEFLKQNYDQIKEIQKNQIISKEKSFSFFCSKICSIITIFANIFNEYLVKIIYFEDLKSFYDEIDEDDLIYFYERNNLEEEADNSKKIMKNYIDEIFQNNLLFFDDFFEFYDFLRNVLLVYVFHCLYKPDIDFQGSCYYNDIYDENDDIYWISNFIQLDNMENTKNNINGYLNIEF